MNITASLQRYLITGWGSKIRTYEMTGSEPVALPLGDTPIYYCKLYYHIE